MAHFPSTAPRLVAVAVLLAGAGTACSGTRQLDLELDQLDAAIIGSGDASVASEAGASDCSDQDRDGFGRNCPSGPDCDDDDPEHASGREAYLDDDGDGWGSVPRYLCLEQAEPLPAGFSLQFGDCRDDVAEVHPDVELDGCDGVDSDCDELVDEDQVPVEVLCGLGACTRKAWTSCAEADPLASCVPGEPLADDAVCDGEDEDCDGRVDEEYRPVPSTCSTDACQSEGRIECVQGSLLDSCTAPVPASSDETCDGEDDDCDGEVDEDFASQSTACGTGVCASGGETRCEEGELIDSCTPAAASPGDASCDNRDDDCDGNVDEGYAEVATNCGRGACRRTGVRSCIHGSVVNSCMAGTPAASDTSCDGIDDDCNGQVDEDFVPDARSCGVGACRRSGTTECVQGAVEVRCTAGAPSGSDANCNGSDDDCDGETDEGYLPQSISCGVGACVRSGTRSCVNGSLVTSCQPGAPAQNDASCNGVDNDCDGEVDEHYSATTTNCGQGACAAQGTLSCVDGEEVDSCSEGQAGGSDASCDGIDSDCDGTVDDDYAPRVVSCGVGVCRRTVTTSCVAGAERGCTPGASTGSDNDCDGLDDDCDGLPDDGFVSAATQCGVGACAATGVTSCVNSQIQNSCRPGTPASSDATCNNLDEDCDGTRDEDYSVSTSCGVGVCAREGEETCRNGVRSNSCTPAQPTASSDQSCDGLDQDCSGQADEDYPVAAISCGRGVCQRSGSRECLNGTVVNACTPGEPTATSDTSCNQRDDDCDGLVDDNFASTPTRCGEGACESTGSTSCVGGQVSDSCVARAPLAQRDTSCDGVDDDCDGSEDEEFASTPTRCGVGVCAAEGSLTCVQGVPTNSCRPGTPSSSDARCDNTDEDCDGRFDEDFQGAGVDCSIGQCAARGEWVCREGETVSTCEPPDNSCEPYGKDVCEDGRYANSYRPCTEEFCWTESVCDVAQGRCEQGRLCGTNECGEPCCVESACGVLSVCAGDGTESCPADCSGRRCGTCVACPAGCNANTGRCRLVLIDPGR